MRLMLLVILMSFLGLLMTGCGGKDASANAGATLSGTAVLTFHLPDEGGQIRCPANLTDTGKIQINQLQKAGTDQFRLNGMMQISERTSTSARIFVRAMLYKNGQPDGSFDFTVELTPGKTKILNLGQGMMLHASL